MITVLVGDVTEYLCERAKQYSKSAVLLTEKNHKEIFNRNYGVYYTSLGDFQTMSFFSSVLLKADSVIFEPPPNNCWNDTDQNTHSELETETKEHLYQWSWVTKKSIKNLPIDFENPDFSNKLSKIPRVSELPQIWNAGCSMTVGEGVTPDQRYGALVSKQLSMPITMLSQGGSSLGWAADQILLSDILPNDIVIWGLTTWHRYSYFLHNKRMYHVKIGFTDMYPLMENVVSLDWVSSPHVLHEALQKIVMVRNYVEKTGAKLYLVGILTNDSLVSPHVESLPNFVRCRATKKWIDLGTDNSHPGPKQHEEFAKDILKMIANSG